jgi:hypothetical protein
MIATRPHRVVVFPPLFSGQAPVWLAKCVRKRQINDNEERTVPYCQLFEGKINPIVQNVKSDVLFLVHGAIYIKPARRDPEGLFDHFS